jgi:hypothetical protein
VTRWLFRYAPPSFTVRRASDRLLTRPVCWSRGG